MSNYTCKGRGSAMASYISRNCGSICKIGLLLLAVLAGLGIILLGVMISSKYSPQVNQQPLVIRLNSFSVSGLNVSNSVSEANWVASFLFGNRHDVLEISIESLESYVYYNRQDALSCTALERLHLGPKKQKSVRIMFNASGCVGGEQPFIEDRVLKEIKRDGENGTLHLGLELNLQVSYKKGTFWSWPYQLKPRCSKLDLVFMSDSGTGTLPGNEPKVCSVPLIK